VRNDEGISNSGAPSPICVSTRERLWRYIDRELTAPELSEISGHLKTCPDCGREYEARAREAKLYRLAFVEAPFGEGFVNRFRKRLAAEALPAHDPSKVQVPERSRGRRSSGGGAGTFFFGRSRGFFGRVALAAALLVIASSMFFGLRKESSLGSIDPSDASGAVMVRGDRLLPASVKSLRPGDAFRVPEAGDILRLSLHDGSKVSLSGPAQMRINPLSRPRGIFRADLDQGRLTANVRKRPEQEFEVWTPHAVARVIGTEFTLSVGPSETLLVVRRGKVWFRSRRETEWIEVVPASGPCRVIDGAAPVVPATPLTDVGASPPDASAVENPPANKVGVVGKGAEPVEPPPLPLPKPGPPSHPGLDQPGGSE
jgi:hypothetical protein